MQLSEEEKFPLIDTKQMNFQKVMHMKTSISRFKILVREMSLKIVKLKIEQGQHQWTF